MTQEIEIWIEESNPIKTINEDVDVLLCGAWQEGATAMAEHLQNQPLTNEQLDRVFALYDQMMLESLDKDKPLSFQERNNYIIKHWSND